MDIIALVSLRCLGIFSGFFWVGGYMAVWRAEVQRCSVSAVVSKSSCQSTPRFYVNCAKSEYRYKAPSVV